MLYSLRKEESSRLIWKSLIKEFRSYKPSDERIWFLVKENSLFFNMLSCALLKNLAFSYPEVHCISLNRKEIHIILFKI